MKKQLVIRVIIYLHLVFIFGLLQVSCQTDSEESLRIHGYQKEVPVTIAVKEFNQRAQMDSVGKNQKPLNEEELLAAIRGWNLGSDSIDPAVFLTFKKIADTGLMPIGSYIRFISGLIALDGYDIDVWFVELRVGLNRYPADLAEMPIYLRRIRTEYISSRPNVK